jgi:hypothetical protein
MSDTSSEYSENMDNTIVSVSSKNSEPTKTSGEHFSQDIMILADHICKWNILLLCGISR